MICFGGAEYARCRRFYISTDAHDFHLPTPDALTDALRARRKTARKML